MPTDPHSPGTRCHRYGGTHTGDRTATQYCAAIAGDHKLPDAALIALCQTLHAPALTAGAALCALESTLERYFEGANSKAEGKNDALNSTLAPEVTPCSLGSAASTPVHQTR